MEQRRRVTTVRQLEMLIDFLDGHRNLALSRLKSKAANRLWREVAELLNPFGPHRSGKEWAKVWIDLKCKVRTKLVANNVAQRATGGGPQIELDLTPLESRVAKIIGNDVCPLSNVMQNQLGDWNRNEEASLDNIGIEEQNHHMDGDVSPVILINVPHLISPGHSPAREQETESVNTPQSTSIVAGATNSTNRAQARRANTSHRAQTTGRLARARVERRTTRAQERSPRAPQSPARSTLDRARDMVLRVEELRAEADLKNAQAFCTVAESIRLFAESVDRMTRQYCFQNGRNERLGS